MFAVVGEWRAVAPATTAEQRESLEGIVRGVAGLPKLVKGYWSSNEDGTRRHTFIVFEDRDAADAFAADVRGNTENQKRAGIELVSLATYEVTAQTAVV